MVNAPAHRNLFGPLQREEIRQDNEKQNKIDEEVVEEEEEEDVEDEDETEIQRLIRISQHHLLKAGNVSNTQAKRMPQSCSAHANLGMASRRPKRNWPQNDAQLEMNAEGDEMEDEDEEEDSDEELFAAHNSLLPLRKSKSAFAGFQSNFVKSTKPFGCPVIYKKDETMAISQKDEDEAENENGLKEIAEMIDLRRGDILEFCVDDGPKQCKANDEPNCSSSSSISTICPRGSCWSAPACPNDSERELSSASSEEDAEIDGTFRRKKPQRRRSGFRRKPSSWSAPSQLDDDQQQMIDEREWKEDKTEEEEFLEPWKRRRSVRIKEFDEEDYYKFSDEHKLENEQNEEANGREDEEEVNEEENEEEEIEEDEEQMIISEPTNLKCLEMDEQMDEAMSTGEEEEEDEDEGEDELLKRKKTQNLHMRVFVQRNNNAQMFHRGRHFPSSRSDSQLLWHRNSSGQAGRAPPPPAPFPLEEGEEEMMELKGKGMWRIREGGGGMAHSRTYGGFMGGMEEDEQNGKMMMNYGEDDEEEEMEIQKRLDELEIKAKMNQMNTSKHREEAKMMDDGPKCVNALLASDNNVQNREEIVNAFEISEESPKAKTIAFDGHRPKCLNLLPNNKKDSPIPQNDSMIMIPMVDADDCCQTPMHSMSGNYLPLPLGNSQMRSKLAANANLENSYSSSSYYSEEDEENGAEWHRGFSRNSRGKVLMQRSAAARLCRRGSPPLAQNELMSESEISDLEQQIASGRLIKSYAGMSKGEELLDADEEEEEKQEEKVEEREENGEEAHEDEYPLELESKEEMREAEEKSGRIRMEFEEDAEEDDEDEDDKNDGKRRKMEDENQELVKEENEEDEIESNDLEEGIGQNNADDDDDNDEKNEEDEEVDDDHYPREEVDNYEKTKDEDEENDEQNDEDERREEDEDDDEEEAIQNDEKKEKDEERNEANCQHQIFSSSSMPSIAGTKNCALNLDERQQPNSYWGPAHVRADFWQSEYPIGEESGWDEGGDGDEVYGHQIDYPKMMHRSLTVQSEYFEGERPRRRRMLPLRPDQIEQLKRRQSANETMTVPPLHRNHQNHPICAEEEYLQLQSTSHSLPHSNQHQPLLTQISPDTHCYQSLSPHQNQQKRRQLPKTPPSPIQKEGIEAEDPLEQIDIATATKEYLLSVLHQQKQQRPRTMIHDGHVQNAGASIEREEEEEENYEDYSPPPVLPSPSVIQRPILPMLPLHQPTQKFGQSTAPDEQYKLSYGMDQSALKLANRRRPLSIEGSFYEDIDGLNGNLTGAAGGFYAGREQHHGWTDELLYTPDDEGERRRISGYNLADGAKSSSGISSCCTTSSRSNEAADADFQQLFMRRQKRKGEGKNGAKSAADDPHAPTHRVQCPFMPRHADELRLERGDALHMIEKYDDHWCLALNLRTGQRGIFPEAHIVEIDLVDEICRSVLPEMNHEQGKERDTFYLTMLASIEVAHHKGNDVLVQGINKVCSMYLRKEEILVPQTVLMEISFRGIHVIDKRKKDIFRCPTFDFFYSLQNISFCGAHPKELRYFGFITKHPLLPRFACHVFMSNESTQPIVEAIGRAFKRSYDEYMAFAHPTEDIFLE